MIKVSKKWKKNLESFRRDVAEEGRQRAILDQEVVDRLREAKTHAVLEKAASTHIALFKGEEPVFAIQVKSAPTDPKELRKLAQRLRTNLIREFGGMNIGEVDEFGYKLLATSADFELYRTPKKTFEIYSTRDYSVVRRFRDIHTVREARIRFKIFMERLRRQHNG